MQAILNNQIIADSNDTIEAGGYAYFPSSSVQLAWLEKSPKTASDRACPHGVQFYDAVLGGSRHARVAWSYEAPLAALRAIGGRFGFWEDVIVR